jgi:hypothetical protein
VDVEPDAPPPSRQRGVRFAIFVVLVAMVALAAWAWWIPNRVFDPWIAQVLQWVAQVQERLGV